ncbi:MAG: DPP IV N-terminal domain-containing protein [Phycisphaeraceae bacterium]|nr:DPP IV N-terminal domain-containing protein [Phycisphaeraceae bacterium]
MSKVVWVFVAVVLAVPGACAQPTAQGRQPDQPVEHAAAGLRTVAESSDYTKTSRYADVVGLLDAIAASSPKATRLEMGRTHQDRAIPLLVISDKPVKSARDARKLKKPVVLLLGGIHAGEVDGKEALPMLARQILHPTEAEEAFSKRVLEDLVVVIAPVYNADGNEDVGDVRERRPEQVGPEGGVGTRENAQGLDLNRDFVKLAAPETRALVKFINEWDPAVVVDTHTTDGSFHQYLITYAGPKVPAGDSAMGDYVNGTLLPEISRRLEARTGIKSFFYGNFSKDRGAWETFPAEARYGTSYVGLRNRVGILVESYSHAPYRERVRGTLEFCREVLEYAAENREAIWDLEREADQRAIDGGRRPAPDDVVALRTKAASRPQKVTVLGWEEVEVDGVVTPTDRPREYEVELRDRFESTLDVPMAWAYMMPASETAIVEVLQRHGIEVEELREDVELDVGVYSVGGITRSERPFQGRRLVDLEVRKTQEARSFPPGTIVVRTGQKRGRLASYLLEPACEDGLGAWGFLGDSLAVGAETPVVRLDAPVGLTTCAVRPLPEDRKVNQPLTFEAIYGAEKAPDFGGDPVGGIKWMKDGKHFLQAKDRSLWKVAADTGRMERFIDPEVLARALEGVPSIDAKQAKKISERTSFTMTEDFTGLLFEHENDLYYAVVDGSAAERLTSSPEKEELASFSPDGAMVAFVRDNDLWVVDRATRTSRQLTTGGTDLLRHGKNDWVYFEEVFGRNWRAYWWAPDSSRIALLEVDSRQVPTFTVVNETTDPQRVEVTPYPKPGQPNPVVRLGVVSAAGGDVTWAEMPDYDPGAFLITGVFWWPDSRAAMVGVQDRTQTWLDVCAVDAENGSTKKLFRETTDAWVEQLDEPKFMRDGSFLVLLERSGYKHPYHFDREGHPTGASAPASGDEGPRPILNGDWEDRQIVLIEGQGEERAGDSSGPAGAAASGSPWVYLAGTQPSPIAPGLYRVRLDGSGFQSLTTESGSHSIVMNPTGELFVDTWSNVTTPMRVVLRSTDGGGAVRTIDTNPVHVLDEYDFGDFELVRVPVGSGEDSGSMQGAVTYPPRFDPSRTEGYPVWFLTYGGPHAPTISDSWANGRVWEQVLAQAGIVVFRADPRSASGVSARSAWRCYKELGVPELRDVEDGIRWFTGEHPWADPGRIGMHGHSYGGFLTAYAMTHSSLFAAGIAGAPVTDWRDYDSIYTERLMLTPQQNPDGYRRSSVVRAAKDLRGRLLLVHGLMDDNVHPQNSMKLAKALQSAGKQFDQAVYPTNRHGITGKQYQRLMYDFILRTMTPGGATSEPPAPEQGEAAASVAE